MYNGTDVRITIVQKALVIMYFKTRIQHETKLRAVVANGYSSWQQPIALLQLSVKGRCLLHSVSSVARVKCAGAFV